MLIKEQRGWTVDNAVKKLEKSTPRHSAAALYLDAAEDVAWQIQDATRLSEVRDTLRSMRLLWPDEAKVKTLQEKLSTRQSHQTL